MHSTIIKHVQLVPRHLSGGGAAGDLEYYAIKIKRDIYLLRGKSNVKEWRQQAWGLHTLDPYESCYDPSNEEKSTNNIMVFKRLLRNFIFAVLDKNVITPPTNILSTEFVE